MSVEKTACEGSAGTLDVICSLTTQSPALAEPDAMELPLEQRGGLDYTRAIAATCRQASWTFFAQTSYTCKSTHTANHTYEQWSTYEWLRYCSGSFPFVGPERLQWLSVCIHSYSQQRNKENELLYWICAWERTWTNGDELQLIYNKTCRRNMIAETLANKQAQANIETCSKIITTINKTNE